jgi:AcrR family transcriptional regulator
MNSRPDHTTAQRRWHGTLRAERDSQRRARLLDAALNLYGTIGFRRTSVQALCQESGVSSRSFYELFPTQEGLLEDLYIDLNEEITAALDEARIASTATLAEAARQIVGAALSPMLDDERKARVLEIEAVGICDSLEERRHQTMRLLAASVQRAFDELDHAYGLTVRTDSNDLTSIVLVGGITEALVQRIHTPAGERSSRDEFLTAIAEVALRAHGIVDREFRLRPV